MPRKKMTEKELMISRWLRALTIAKILFEDQGYHTLYLEQIEKLIKEEGVSHVSAQDSR